MASIGASLLIVAASEFYLLTIKQWDVQSSYGASTATTGAVLEHVNAIARYASDFSTTTSGANTLYVFTLPNNTPSGVIALSKIDRTSATGSYIPQRASDGSLQFVAGPEVAFYLSDTTGSTSVTGGTILWRATAPAGTSTFTQDTLWSMANTSVGRYSGIQTFTITQPDPTSNVVEIKLTVQSKSGHNAKTYTTSRQLYMSSVIFGASIEDVAHRKIG